jgi:NAD(P)-dependent dehydrogenase (short-subunit alcohol dehydrogenase family)
MSTAFSPGNVAVITGAASGIGRATAEILAGKGMRIAILDADSTKLPGAEAAVRSAGADAENVLSFEIDVSDADAMQSVAGRVQAEWGAPTFLMNNAAIRVHGGPRDMLDALDNWRHLFDVNFFGVLNGVAAFAPAMLDAGKEAIVVNTGSKQGLTNPPGNPAYNCVKAALNAYTMNLAHNLRSREGCKVTAHLLIPGWTTTGDSEHKPGAWLPEQVTRYMLDHLETGDFYIICPDDETTSEMDKKRILWQALDIVENRPALSRWHGDYGDAFSEFMKKPL